VCYEIEPNTSKDRATCMHEGDNPSFWDELLYVFVFDMHMHLCKSWIWYREENEP
jgi:hypothetical protein